MADRLARIYGTEEDKVNCPFYHKIGACRHGDRCGRVHNKPLFSQTVALGHMYENPAAKRVATGGRLTPAEEAQVQKEFEDFYIDVFDEVAKYGTVEEMHVCDNLADHLVGNVYVKYADEEDAQKALAALNGRWYTGRQLAAEFCPVTDFHNARCKQADETGGCSRAGYCNYMHMKRVQIEMYEDLLTHQPTPPAKVSLGLYGEQRRAGGQGGQGGQGGHGGYGGYGAQGGGGYNGGHSGGGYRGGNNDRDFRRDDRGGGGGYDRDRDHRGRGNDRYQRDDRDRGRDDDRYRR